MTRGLVISAVPFLPLERREFGALSDYQEVVQGFIEPIALGEHTLTLYVNEEGKRRRMSVNERATALWWLLTPDVRGYDVIVGDAVLCVEGELEGDLLDVLPRVGGFRVEVQLHEMGDEWVGGPRDFSSWFEAAKFALALTQKFEFVSNARVLAS